MFYHSNLLKIKVSYKVSVLMTAPGNSVMANIVLFRIL